MRDLPTFVKPNTTWAWSRTADKVSQQSGRDYEQWTPKQFAAATVIYRNTIKKYGSKGEMDGPFECSECESDALFYPDDFICRDCRDERAKEFA